MADELVSALINGPDLRVALALTSELCRHARGLAALRPASAAILAEGLTAGALMGSLMKERTRLNLQLECDGPLRGLFVDADGQGEVRGYVKNRAVEHVGSAGEFHWRPVLGNSGFLSVLRDLGGGEPYRSSVELRHFDLARDLEAYFDTSEQVRTQVLLACVPDAGDELAVVGGLLLQPLPGGDVEALAQHGARLKAPGTFPAALRAAPGSSPVAVLKALFPGVDLEIMARFPLRFRCSCSEERVKRALLAMGREELEDLLSREGQAEVTCQFCSTRYVIPPEQIRALLPPA
jgi:molecular chaperone Hsp33